MHLFLDIGGYSSRPGATDIPVDEEKRRVLKAISILKSHFPKVILSIDTFRSEVANAAVQEGASIVNDISAGELDQGMFDLVARHKVPYILMHMRGTPQSMSKLTEYVDLKKEILDYFHPKLITLIEKGVTDLM